MFFRFTYLVIGLPFLDSCYLLKVTLYQDRSTLIPVLLSSPSVFACIQKWMDGGRLKLNPEDRIHCHWRQTGQGVNYAISLPVSQKFNLPTNKVKNLGVTFDSGNTFASHITKVCYACYCHLKDFRRIHSSVWRQQPCWPTL